MIDVYVWNQTALVTDDDGQKATAAIQRQMTLHVGPAWDVTAVLHYVKHTDVPPPNVWVVKLLDRSDVDGALGYHDQKQCGIVGVQTCIDDGVSWSSCLSHECTELICDPECVRCFQVGNEVVGLEPGDAVEGFVYTIDGIEVQDFVLPAYFIDGASGPYDYMNKLSDGYPTLGPSGYNSSAPVGDWRQTSAEKVRSAKMNPGKLSRRGRRARRGK